MPEDQMNQKTPILATYHSKKGRSPEATLLLALDPTQSGTTEEYFLLNFRFHWDFKL